jgi:hypothetical protein
MLYGESNVWVVVELCWLRHSYCIFLAAPCSACSLKAVTFGSIDTGRRWWATLFCRVLIAECCVTPRLCLLVHMLHHPESSSAACL